MARRKTPSICARPGCPEITPTTYCPAHAPKAWVGSTGPKRTISKRWKQIRVAVLKRDGYICQLKYLDVCIGRATICDHIVPDSEGGAPSMANGQAACVPCHRVKTAAEAARGRARTRGNHPV
jgi:5-methylcytosine-specific restriction protein A